MSEKKEILVPEAEPLKDPRVVPRDEFTVGEFGVALPRTPLCVSRETVRALWLAAAGSPRELRDALEALARDAEKDQ